MGSSSGLAERLQWEEDMHTLSQHLHKNEHVNEDAREEGKKT